MILTVFTPTYNRANKLRRVYESLKAQSLYDFEWLIIDDGSVDNTEETVKDFLCETDFDVRYYKQENGGKHRAYNKALELCCGDYFFCVDSDDTVSINAVENIRNAVKSAGKDKFIIAYKSESDGRLLSDTFPDETDSVSLFELGNKYACRGEFSLIFPTELAREFPFPVFDGENFITESVVYDRIGEKYKAYLLPEILTVCEYQEEGLTQNINKIMKKNPAGYCLYFSQRIDMAVNMPERFITAGKYHCFRMLSKNKAVKYAGKHIPTVAVSRILGIIFLIYYKIMRGF